MLCAEPPSAVLVPAPAPAVAEGDPAPDEDDEDEEGEDDPISDPTTNRSPKEVCGVQATSPTRAHSGYRADGTAARV